MQGALRNPLADPFLLGVSSGAALGAALVLTLGSGSLPVLGTAPGAMIGAFAALAISLLLGRTQDGLRIERERLILAGVSVSTMFGAGVSLLKALDEESVSGIVFWILGSFQGRGWIDIPLVLIPSLLGILLLVPCWRCIGCSYPGRRGRCSPRRQRVKTTFAFPGWCGSAHGRLRICFWNHRFCRTCRSAHFKASFQSMAWFAHGYSMAYRRYFSTLGRCRRP